MWDGSDRSWACGEATIASNRELPKEDVVRSSDSDSETEVSRDVVS